MDLLMKYFLVFVSSVFLTIACKTESLSAGFDCAKARTTVEKTICSEGKSKLSKLDEELVAKYKQITTGTSVQPWFVKQQKSWLTDRNKCNDDQFCLIESYQQRLKNIDWYIKNCVNPEGPIGKIVCADEKLSTLDQEGEYRYDMMMRCGKGKFKEQLETEQACWLRERNACPDTACALKSYVSHIDTLSTVCMPKTPPPDPWGAILPLPEWMDWGGDNGSGRFSAEGAYKNNEDDIVIVYSFYVEKTWVARFYNFTKGIMYRECKRYSDCYNKELATGTADPKCDESYSSCYKEHIDQLHPLSQVSGIGGFYLKNGNKFIPETGLRCIQPLEPEYKIVSGTEIVRHEKIVWIPPKAHTDVRTDWCAAELTSYIREEHFVRAVSLPLYDFWQIDTDRLLGLIRNIPVAIVFDNDLNSPYINSGNFLFKVDAERINKKYTDCLLTAISCAINPTYSMLEIADKCIIDFIRGEQK